MKERKEREKDKDKGEKKGEKKKGEKRANKEEKKPGLDRADEVAGEHGKQGRDNARAKQGGR